MLILFRTEWSTSNPASSLWDRLSVYELLSETFACKGLRTQAVDVRLKSLYQLIQTHLEHKFKAYLASKYDFPVSECVCAVAGLLRNQHCCPDRPLAAAAVLLWILFLDFTATLPRPVIDGEFVEHAETLATALHGFWLDDASGNDMLVSLRLIFSEMSAGKATVSPAIALVVARVPPSFATVAADYLCTTPSILVRDTAACMMKRVWMSCGSLCVML